MFIRKALAGNIPGYSWETNGDVLDIPDDLAQEILRIPQGGFTVAWNRWPAQDVTPEDQEPVRDEVPAEETVRRKGRPPLPRDERGRIIRNQN